MSKPVIGVMPLYDEKRDSIWMLPGYTEGLQAAGAIPVILPFKLSGADFDEMSQRFHFDGYLFTGGHDVSPSLYNEQPLPGCGPYYEERDAQETMIFNECMRSDIPVLGICRGIQIINVLMGGTLYQDLPAQYTGTAPDGRRIDHHMTPPYDRVQHLNTIVAGTPLHDLLGKDVIGVNSYHHQAVNRLGHGLEVMACSEDGLVEAVRVPDRTFIWAVQWHPEFSFRNDPDSMKIFDAFVKAAAGSESSTEA